ncbi:conserved hypothetical protein, partial [Listeria seeligeri FSL S4-171]
MYDVVFSFYIKYLGGKSDLKKILAIIFASAIMVLCLPNQSTEASENNSF